ERDQASEALGGAQPPQPAQFRPEPVDGATATGRHRRRRGDAEPGAMRKGAIDELDEVDPDDAEHEDAETGRRNAKRRPGPLGSARGQVRFGRRLQNQLEPSGFLGFKNARTQPLSRRLRFSGHARASSSRKSSALSRFIWGMPSPAALVIRGGWNTGNSVNRSPQNPVGGGVTGTIPGKKRMRRSPPSGNPMTISTLRPSITSVPSSVQRIEASAAAAARARAALARRLGASTKLAISASRWSRCRAGTWSALVAANKTRSMRAPNSRRRMLRRPKRNAARIVSSARR